MNRWLLAVLLAALGGAAAAQSPEDLTITAAPLRTGELIKLDGTLSHPAWQSAPVYQRFVEKFPDTGGAPSQETRVQVLFNEQAIYVGVTALDTRPDQIRDLLVRTDGVNRTQDFVVVYIDAIGTRSSAQFFRVNAAGSRADGLHSAADDSEDFSPDYDWDAATARTAEGWTTVMRLPFASLRFAQGRQDWRIMVGRRMPRQQFHLFTSALIPRDAPSFIAALQPLAGVQLPISHNFLTVRPGLTVRSTRDAGVSKTQTEASLDIKWRPLAELVVDGTLNPDFSQVALDVPQLAGNSRFALSLPEKRPFFFESSDLLRTPTDAMYTRSFTQPRAGLRATWRGPEWAGTAFAIRDRGQGLVLLPGVYGTDATEQPGSDSVVLRARKDTGELSWGGLVAARRYEQDRGDNTVLGPDVSWQINDQWRMRGQWLHARTTALPVSGGALQMGPAEDGDRLRLRLFRQSDGGESSLGLDDISAGFRHDTGFVNQSGVRRLELFHSVGWRQLGPLNDFYVNVEAFQVRDKLTDAVVQEVLRPGMWFTAARNIEAYLNLFVHARSRTSATAALLAERYISTGLVMTPATWFPLVDVSVDLGQLADTAAGPLVNGTPQGFVRRGGRVNFSAKLRPLPALEVEPRLNTAFLQRDGGLTYRESVQQWLAVWHFDARHNLRAIIQRSFLDRRAEPGVVATLSMGRTESLTYAFRHTAGTRVYVGATRSRQGIGAPRSRTEGFIKLEADMDDLRAWGS